MGFLIIAIIASRIILDAWEEGRQRSRAAWEDSRQATRERRAAFQERHQARRAARARRFGQARSNGPSDALWWPYAAGWLIAALGRGTAAAVVGAKEGAQTGAREGHRLGRERAFQRKMRQRREAAAYGNGQRAGDEAGYDRAKREHPEWRPDPDAGEVVTDPCPHCGVYSADPTTCRCRATARRAPGPDPASDEEGDPTEPIDDVIDAEVVDDLADQENTTQPAIEGKPDMAQITSGISGGDAEGYAPALNFVHEVQKLLSQLTEIVSDFGDGLTAKNLDQTTTTTVSELYDQLEAATNTAEGLGKHVEDKHGEVAHAVAGAGGSDEIADPTFYDHV